MASTRKIEFTDVPAADGVIHLTGGGIEITFKPSRQSYKQAAIKTTVADQAKTLADAINNDYNDKGVYTITYDTTAVYIEHFDNDHFDSGTNTSTNTTLTLTTTTQDAVVTVAEAYSENTVDKCTTILMDLTFSVSTGGTIVGLVVTRSHTSIETLYSDPAHNSNTLQLALTRQQYSAMTVSATIGGVTTVLPITPPKNRLEIKSVVVDDGAFSSKVTINSNLFLGSTENQYAIEENGISLPTYQLTNVFTGILPGFYNVFIKDKYGCVKSDTLLVEEGGNSVATKKFWISKIASHYFADRTNATPTVGNVTNFLSHDDPYQIKAENFKQVFSDEQLTTTQFWSGYPRHTANMTITDPDPNVSDIVVSLPITQRTDNINRDTYLEGTAVYDATYGAVKVSFTPGDIYDENGVVIGQHTFDETLPDYYETGVSIEVLGYVGVITAIVEDAGIKYAITNITDGLISGTQTIHTIHQATDYEVYEFEVDFSSYLDKTAYLTINAFANNTTTEIAKIYKSECFEVIDHGVLIEENYHICRFYNYENDSEVNYTAWNDGENIAGNRIEHLRNIPYHKPLADVSESDVQVEKLDNRVAKIDYSTIDLFQSSFEKMPSLFAGSTRKLFANTEVVEIDNLRMVAQPVELKGENQWRTLSVQLAIEGGGNEFLVTGGTIKSFYPVVT